MSADSLYVADSQTLLWEKPLWNEAGPICTQANFVATLICLLSIDYMCSGEVWPRWKINNFVTDKNNQHSETMFWKLLIQRNLQGGRPTTGKLKQDKFWIYTFSENSKLKVPQQNVRILRPKSLCPTLVRLEFFAVNIFSLLSIFQNALQLINDNTTAAISHWIWKPLVQSG